MNELELFMCQQWHRFVAYNKHMAIGFKSNFPSTFIKNVCPLVLVTGDSKIRDHSFLTQSKNDDHLH